jgi:hypothetical protein
VACYHTPGTTTPTRPTTGDNSFDRHNYPSTAEMTVALHGTYAVLHFCLTLWNRHLFLQRGQQPLMLGLLIVTACLVYDNLVLSLGSWIGIGSLLAALSVPRFVFHALGTPGLLWTGLYIALHCQLSWAATSTGYRAIGIAFLALVAMGIQEHLVDYQAYPVCQPDGLVRYSQSLLHPELFCDGISYPTVVKPHNPPWGSIGTVLVLSLIGTHAAVLRGNGWLLIGALLIMATAGAGPTLWQGNGGEVLLVASMNLAMRRKTILSNSSRSLVAELTLALQVKS